MVSAPSMLIPQWPADVGQLLEEHHLVALSDDAGRRQRFAAQLEELCRTMDGTRVIRIGGEGVGRMETIEAQLRAAAGGHHGAERGLAAIASMLRKRGSAIKRQVFVWEEADAMLDADVELFGHIVQVLLAVAAEREHFSDDRLVIQRVVFVGGPKLGAYTEYASGQFNRWGHAIPGIDLTGAIAAMPQPRVLVYQIEG
jgi:hypothetical protein